MLQQAYTPSNTGLASFVHASADYDLAPIGIGSMREQVDRLAEFGRNGDIYVVHAAEGETVIPMEVLDSNPKVKEMLFAQMRDMGMDPERYVVGNELNSINPDTGMPEFFFSSIGRAIKKIFKRAAPILVAVAGNAILPGIGGILASMAYTKLSGGSWKDTLFAGVAAYAGGVIAGGIGGLSSGAGFMSGASAAAAAPWNAITNLGTTFQSGILGSGVGAAGGVSGYRVPAADMGDAAGGFPVGDKVTGTWAGDAAVAGGGWDPGGTILPAESAGSGLTPGAGPTSGASSGTIPVNFVTTSNIPPVRSGPAGLSAQQDWGYGEAALGGPELQASAYVPSAVPSAVPSVVPSAGKTPGFFERTLGLPEIDKGISTAGDWAFRGGETEEVVKQNILDAEQAFIDQRLAQGFKIENISQAEVTAAGLKAAPSDYVAYGPTVVGLTGVAAASGAFGESEEEKKRRKDEEAEQARIEAIRNERAEPIPTVSSTGESYRVADLSPSFQNVGLNPVTYPSYQYPSYAADGGLIDGQPRYLNYGGTARYPRREMLVEGPGTERSDDIPAMLSDGEFVLNSRSVRGADPTGQGNRYRGAQNLYNMMRNFEMRG